MDSGGPEGCRGCCRCCRCCPLRMGARTLAHSISRCRAGWACVVCGRGEPVRSVCTVQCESSMVCISLVSARSTKLYNSTVQSTVMHVLAPQSSKDGTRVERDRRGGGRESRESPSPERPKRRASRIEERASITAVHCTAKHCDGLGWEMKGRKVKGRACARTATQSPLPPSRHERQDATFPGSDSGEDRGVLCVEANVA